MRRRLTFVIALGCSILFVIAWTQGLLFRNKLFIMQSENQLQTVEKQYNIHTISKKPVLGENNIFFLETSCTLNQKRVDDIGLVLNKRQACSMESAAKLNPDATIYLLYSCPISGGLENSLQHVKELLTYPNVRLWKLNISEFLFETPLQNWDFNAALLGSKWPVQHSSDVLRYVALWKYGGTYLDLDVIIRKPLDNLGSNYLGKENSNVLGDCVINLSHDGIGHQVAENCLYEMLTDFQGMSWNHNGPDTLTKVFREICGFEKIDDMNRDRCQGLKVLSEKYFTPFPYQLWRILFKSTELDDSMHKFSESYGIHTWNTLSKEESVNLLIKTPFGLLATEFCPLVHACSLSEINF